MQQIPSKAKECYQQNLEYGKHAQLFVHLLTLDYVNVPEIF